MNPDSGPPAGTPASAQPWWRRVFSRPATRPGWWSFGIGLGIFLLIGLFQVLDATGQRGGILFIVVGLALPLFALAAAVLAAVAIFRQGERSLISFTVLLLGLFFLVLMVFELTIPH